MHRAVAKKHDVPCSNQQVISADLILRILYRTRNVKVSWVIQKVSNVGSIGRLECRQTADLGSGTTGLLSSQGEKRYKLLFHKGSLVPLRKKY